MVAGQLLQAHIAFLKTETDGIFISHTIDYFPRPVKYIVKVIPLVCVCYEIYEIT